MKNINAGLYCVWIGLGAATAVSIFLTMYTKWKKVDSFILLNSGNQIILSRNHFTALLASIRYFFILSCFTFIVATNKKNIILQLVFIYSACFVLAAVNYIGRNKFKVVFDKMKKTVFFKSTTCSFENCELIIESDRRWFIDDSTSYGLYLRDDKMKYRLIYGYSIYRDILKLEESLKALLYTS